MTRSLRRSRTPKRLLEVGPGTGPFTKSILNALSPNDELHIVEINEAFCAHLEKEILAPFRRRMPNAKIKLHCAPIEDAPLEGTFDFIVCGLPFNNFPPRLVRSILRHLMTLLTPGGELVYFEYAGVRVMKAPFVDPAGRRRLQRIGKIGKAMRRQHEGRREFVLGNLPPAFAVRLTRGDGQGR